MGPQSGGHRGVGPRGLVLLLRAAEGFTGRANSVLPLGDPGVPLPEAVTFAENWYHRRNLRPMIAVPTVLLQGAPRSSLENHLAERCWVLRPGQTFVMTAEVATRGARQMMLQVDSGNAPAHALYQRYGFRDSHQYHYLIAP